jgi:hypothetical protein
LSWWKKLTGKDNQPATPQKIDPVASFDIPPSDEDEPLYQDQILRKQWAESVLEEQGVPINRHLPCIEGELQARVPPVKAVANRLLALSVVAVKGQGMAQAEVEAIVDVRGIRPLLTPKELAFINDLEPSEHDCIQFVWRYEAAWVLFWALNFTGAPLSYPDGICDVDLLLDTVRDTPDLTINGLQSTNNILNEADIIYRYHWAVRDAQINGNDIPASLNASVVMERHYALNWLVGYMGADWDDISTDT